jgi:REP element-mobilizing transposase RayT
LYPIAQEDEPADVVCRTITGQIIKIQVYFVTVTVINWIPVFSNPDIAKIIFDSLAFQQREKRIMLHAYVLMENHLHLVVQADNLSKEMANFKSFTARQGIDYFTAHNNQFYLRQFAFHKLPHRTDRDYQFWQEGSHPEQIHNQRMYEQKIRYIHENPVRRGYVDEPEHWRYSSARYYAGMEAMLELDLD